MKTNRNRALILTAVALTLSAAAAYGQTKTTADIPFAFRTSAGVHQAGKYDVISVSPNNSVLAIRNVATRKAEIVGLGNPEGGPAAAGADPRPRLVFRCGGQGGCYLAQLWTGDGFGRSYAAPRTKAADYEFVAVVYLERQPVN